MPLVTNYQLYPPAAPHVWYGVQNRMQTTTNRFSQQPTTPARPPASQPPIGSQVGANIVGVPQQQQQHSTLQPIGSHLGGAGHVRGNVSYHQNQVSSFCLKLFNVFSCLCCLFEFAR